MLTRNASIDEIREELQERLDAARKSWGPDSEKCRLDISMMEMSEKALHAVPGAIVLDLIYVPPSLRECELGGKMLSLLLSVLDETERICVLTVRPIALTEEEQSVQEDVLLGLYKKHGFKVKVINEKGSNQMVRLPTFPHDQDLSQLICKRRRAVECARQENSVFDLGLLLQFPPMAPREASVDERQWSAVSGDRVVNLIDEMRKLPPIEVSMVEAAIPYLIADNLPPIVEIPADDDPEYAQAVVATGARNAAIDREVKERRKNTSTMPSHVVASFLKLLAQYDWRDRWGFTPGLAAAYKSDRNSMGLLLTVDRPTKEEMVIASQNGDSCHLQQNAMHLACRAGFFFIIYT
jgi:hypothetical protein